ncbi:uncharacterized protein E5676_scaffold522G00100 [Cucumis melo var. makuwa]|uniref:Uncharacterized protein n=1 Tax=Cucumis melo var. makuwa TaxID=1194695 RepID=A0A5A7UIH7_CUCMM|nr:uncharacterized protein E6C27_scaffold190G00460 [Cucumis melo var. makuwa]TYK19097.1 uncharacterized protein E5676_scaffold522G00100 [Cucumis melo var. makuwa]
MKLLSWMQSKLQGKVKFQNKGSYNSSNPSTIEQPAEESSASLPLGLLAIGTFGNNTNDVKVLKTDVENAVIDAKSTSNETDDDNDSSLKDVPELEEELTKLWQQNSQFREEESDDFDDDQTEEQVVKKNIGLVVREWQGDVEKNNDPPISIVKRSVTFLVKKIFICGSGFAPLPPSPPPNFMDRPQDATMKKVRKQPIIGYVKR